MITSDQKRAIYAYDRVSKVKNGEQEDYKILVKGLGTNIIRSGLAVTICHLEREQKNRGGAATQLLNDLAQADWPIPRQNNTPFPKQIRELPLDDYMLMTQEMLQLVQWLKRAVESTF